jgi:hypothetical protein
MLFLGVPAIREEYFYSCCPEPYPTVAIFIFILQEENKLMSTY